MAKRYVDTERIGINAVEKLVLEELKWIFREQPIVDMGIDAQIEQVLANPTGKLIGMQIKAGESHFEIKSSHLVYYGDVKHSNYWLNHSLPVIIVAHLPITSKTYWQVVNKDTIKYTRKAWKIEIPFSNELNKNSIEKLEELLNDSPERIKLQKLLFDRELIEYLLDGGTINIYTEEWINKTLGRGIFKVILIDAGGKEEVAKEWFTYYLGTLEQALSSYFPWADFEVDEGFYDWNFDEDSVYAMYSEDYIEQKEIYPYEVKENEVAAYRINLVLNSLGKSFIEVLKYLEHERQGI